MKIEGIYIAPKLGTSGNVYVYYPDLAMSLVRLKTKSDEYEYTLEGSRNFLKMLHNILKQKAVSNLIGEDYKNYHVELFQSTCKDSGREEDIELEKSKLDIIIEAYLDVNYKEFKKHSFLLIQEIEEELEMRKVEDYFLNAKLF